MHAGRPRGRASEGLRRLARAVLLHRDLDLAAQLAYWSLLALFPFLIFVLTLLGYVPLGGLDRQVLELAYDVLPREVARFFDQTLHEVVGRQRGGLLFVSLGAALFTA